MISLLFQDLSFHSQVKSSFIFGADEEINFSAAICWSFLRSHVRASAQKRRSEIHSSQAVKPAKN